MLAAIWSEVLGLPLIHSPTGFWIIFLVMLAIGVGMSIYFWRKRYLGRS